MRTTTVTYSMGYTTVAPAVPIHSQQGYLVPSHIKVASAAQVVTPGVSFQTVGLQAPRTAMLAQPLLHSAAARLAPPTQVTQPSAADDGWKDSSEGPSNATPLSHRQLQDFVRDGLLVLNPTVPGGDEYHKYAYDIAERLTASGEVGNNCLSEEVAPPGFLDEILDSPEVVGALQALMGEDYVVQPHRHCHISKDGSPGQSLHQDDFFGFDRFRQLAPTDLMLFYYPQTVTPDMGPTAVVPGSQFSRRSRAPVPAPGVDWVPAGPQQPERKMVLDRPGYCMLMHWHLWHRGTQQLGGSAVPIRYAFKLQFRRTRPFLPPPAILSEARAGGNPFTAPSQDLWPSREHRLISAAVWAALCGDPLPMETAAALRGMPRGSALAVASGALPMAQAVVQLVPLLRPVQDPTAFASVNPWLSEEVADTRCEAAAALQNCSFGAYGQPAGGAKDGQLDDSSSSESMASAMLDYVCGSGSGGGTEKDQKEDADWRSHTWQVHPWHADWRLESMLALSALLSPVKLLESLVPLIVPGNATRMQLHSLMGIYNSATRCNALDSAEWRYAADAVKLENALLSCIAWWQTWRQKVMAQAQASLMPMDKENQEMHRQEKMVAPPSQAPLGHCADGGGRYVLAEALRIVGRFGPPAAVMEAVRIIGIPQRTELYCGRGWRRRFVYFVERRRRCPITTVQSAF